MVHFREEATEEWIKRDIWSQKTCVQGLVLPFKSYVSVGNLLNHSESIFSSGKREYPYCRPAFTGLLIHHMCSVTQFLLSSCCGPDRGPGKGSRRRWQLRKGVNEVREWALWMCLMEEGRGPKKAWGKASRLHVQGATRRPEVGDKQERSSD